MAPGQQQETPFIVPCHQALIALPRGTYIIRHCKQFGWSGVMFWFFLRTWRVLNAADHCLFAIALLDK